MGPTTNAQTNIPPIRRSFVGRTTELAELERRIAEGAALVTIRGAGGTGKTSLARRHAALRAGAFAGGTWFVDLTACASLVDLAGELGRVLAVPLTSARTAEEAVREVGRALAKRGATLVVLDNFEQLVEHAAPSVGRWLELAPEATFIVTSRERLRIPGEVVMPLEPLDVPPVDTPAPRVFEFDAVKLFIDRARAAGSAIDPARVDAEVLGAVVRRLEGIPLSIELCATRAPVLGLSQMLEMLSARFDLLALGARGASARTATLRGTIDWSWSLLSPSEKDALAQCSVFRGGFNLDAAAAVLDLSTFGASGPQAALRPEPPSAHGAGAASSLDVLQALHDKSLVGASPTEGFLDERRFSLLESIREYAAEKLAESGAALAVEERHARYFAAAGARWAEQVDGLGGDLPLRRLALEADNLLHAHLCASLPDLAMTALLALEPVLAARGPLGRYVELVARALGTLGPSAELAARARLALGIAETLAGRLADSQGDLSCAATTARASGALSTAALAEAHLGLALVRAGAVEQAEAAFARAREATEAAGSTRIAAEVDNLTAVFLAQTGRTDAALALHERALATFHRVGCSRCEARTRTAIGRRYVEQGRLDLARFHLETAQRIFVRYRGGRDLPDVHLGIGTIELEQGRHAEARACFEEALTTARRAGVPIREASALLWLGHLDLLEARALAARERYAAAIDIFEPTDARGLGVALAASGAGAAMVGLLDESEARFARAQAVVDPIGHPRDRQMLALLRGHLDLARAADPEDARRELRATMDAAIAEGAARSDDTRFALRLLRGAVEDAAQSPESEAPAQGTWTFAADGTHFRPPGRARVNLARRGALIRLLRALLDARLRSPGTALPGASLVDAGWPSQKMAFESGMNRVRVAMCTLRTLGLRDLVQSRDGGYMLDPAVPMEME